MKRIINFSIAWMLFTISLQSANAQKKAFAGDNELGIRIAPSFWNWQNSELVWKRQKSEHQWKRLRVGSVSVNPHFFKPWDTETKLSVAFGKERRYSFHKGSKWQFVCGHEWEFGSRKTGEYSGINASPNNIAVSVGANLVFGLRYKLNDKFGLSVETTPGVSVESGVGAWANNSQSKKANWNVHIFNPRLTLTYAFHKRG